MKICFYGNFSVPYCSEVHHAMSLEALGHEVVQLQEPKVHADEILAIARECDLFCWVSTHGWVTEGDMAATLRALREAGVPSMTFHLDTWLGLRRQREMQGPYWQLDHFFTVDRLMADYLNQNTPVKGHYLTAGVFADEAYMAPDYIKHAYANDVIFVGQKNYHPEWPYRPQLIDWLERTYGPRFTRIAGDCPSGTVRGHELNTLYASSKVVVGDSLCLGFDRPDYWSDRVYETLGRGGFLIHPRVPGMEKQFKDREHLVFYEYGDFAQLANFIDHFANDNNKTFREHIRLTGHEHVRAEHTYERRWQTILDTVFA